MHALQISPKKKHVILGADNSLGEQIGQQITHQIKQQINSVPKFKKFLCLDTELFFTIR